MGPLTAHIGDQQQTVAASRENCRVIRELRHEDAAVIAALLVEANPHQVMTAETLWQQATRRIERQRLRTWVAEQDTEIVGFAWADFEWSVPTPGKGRFWIGVRPSWRGHGIGAALYEHVEAYLRAHGAWRLRTSVDDDRDAERFLAQRGFRGGKVDVVSELALAGVLLPDVEIPTGMRVVPLRDARDRERDLFEICAAGEIDMPGEEPETAFFFDDWLQDDYGSPALSDDGSFVALDGERAVALAFLTVDPARRIAYNQMTATLPSHRRQGLALAVKAAAARWAAAEGYERIVTENDETNAGMLAVNERLGYRPLYDQVSFVLEWERPPVQRR
jgi:GNAT superfamily N-acetyltransferase